MISNEYKNLTFKEFLEKAIGKHSDIETTLDLFIDNASPEYYAFHEYSVKAHTGTVQFSQKGIVYQVNRTSNLTDSTGYMRYIKTVWDDEPLHRNEVNSSYRMMFDVWSDWETLIL